MNRIRSWLYALAVGSLAACGGGGDDAAPVVGPPVVTLDTAHAATATIGAAGGTLAATGADGTTYTLTVPPDALVGEIAITMTPVQSIDRLPLSGGMVGAVHLEPSGLQFARMAWLRIDKSGTAPTGLSLAGFAIANGSASVQRSAAVAGVDSVQIAVSGFSVHGAGFGSSADLDSLEPGAGRTQTEGAAFENAYHTILEPSPATPEQQLAAYLRWFDEGVMPMLQRTTTDVELLQANAEYEFWAWGAAEMLAQFGQASGWDAWYWEEAGVPVASVRQRREAWDNTAGPKYRAAIDANNQLCDEGQSLSALRNTLFLAYTADAVMGSEQALAHGVDLISVAERLCAQLVVENVSLSDPLSAAVPSDLAVSFGLRFRSDPDNLQAVPVRVEFSGVNAVFSNASPVFSDALGGFVVGVAAETAGDPVTVFLQACLALDGDVRCLVSVDHVVQRATAGGSGPSTVLPPEGFKNIYAYDMNGSGHVVGDMWSDRVGMAYVWRGGTPTPLPKMSAEDTVSRASGINNRGDIVGLITGPSGTHAVMWPGGGAPVDLAASAAGLGWVLQEVTSINDKGQMAGYGLHNGTAALFFLDTDNSITKIIDGTGYANVRDLSEDGEVAVQMTSGSNGISFLWRRGGNRIDIQGSVMSVNAARTVAGSVRKSLSSTFGVIWHSPYSDAEITEIVPPDPSYATWPQHIGDDGSVVGFFSGTVTDGNAFSKAFHWKDGRFTDLSALYGSGTNLQRATRVGDGGQVLLWSMRPTEEGNQTFFMVVPGP